MLSNGIRHSCGVMKYKIVLQSNSTWQNIYAEQHVLSCIAMHCMVFSGWAQHIIFERIAMHCMVFSGWAQHIM